MTSKNDCRRKVPRIKQPQTTCNLIFHKTVSGNLQIRKRRSISAINMVPQIQLKSLKQKKVQLHNFFIFCVCIQLRACSYEKSLSQLRRRHFDLPKNFVLFIWDGFLGKWESINEISCICTGQIFSPILRSHLSTSKILKSKRKHLGNFS